MMISVEQAQSSLEELIERAAQAERIVITKDDQPVAELLSTTCARPVPIFGSCRDMLTIVSEDDQHLNDFAGYTR